MKFLQDISAQVLSLNPQLKTQYRPFSRKRRGLPNKTEREFSLLLQAQLQDGEILRYDFEGITLRWADMRYTPDFIVFHHTYISLIEVKGPYIYPKDLVRFKAARASWPQFQFQLHQKSRSGWKRIY